MARDLTLVDRMLEARASGTRVVPPSLQGTPLSWNDAYAIAERLRERRVAAGEHHAGYKLGFTNMVVWTANGLNAPLYAPIFRETIVELDQVHVGDMVAPRIEPELVFALSQGQIAWYALGFELVQCHYADWQFAPTDALVDFGLHAQLVVGERRAFAPGIETALASFDVDLLCDARVVERGNAADVLGGPLRALLWLQEKLRDRGAPLADDAIVTTGSLTAAPFVGAGQCWTARVRGGIDLPDLTLQLSDSP